MSIRVSSTSLISGAIVVGDAGHGVLAQQIATTGDYGPGYAYSSLSFPADNDKEIRGLITTQPALGMLYAYEDTSFTFVGPSGTHNFQYQIYVDGVALGSPQTATINVGGAGSSALAASTNQTATASSALRVGHPLSAAATGYARASGTFPGGGFIPSPRVFISPAREVSFTSPLR